MVEERTQVCCQCGEDECFLEEDAAWIARNSELMSGQSSLSKKMDLYRQLDTERLRDKEAWMDHLRIQGTSQVRCCRLVEEKP